MNPLRRGRWLEELQHLPEGMVGVWIVITQLGDVWFVCTLVALVYWFYDRSAGVFAIAAVIGAIGLTVGLKALFAVPRPPVEAHLVNVEGYGFPSGHAIAATVTWGTLALVLDEIGSPRQRSTVAGVIITVVSASRVGLGVHYTVDVVVGVLVGIGYLAILWFGARENPVRASFAALVVSLVGVAVGGGTDAMTILGAAGGLLLVVWLIDIPRSPWGLHGVLPAVLVGGVVIGVIGLIDMTHVTPPVAIVGGVGSVILVLLLPILIDRNPNVQGALS